MTTSLNISGLSSNIQWGEVVDATIKAMEARTVTPIADQLAKRTAQKDAWNQFRTLVNTLNTNALAVRRGGIGGYLANVPTSPTSGRSLMAASTSSTAVPGKYRVEVLQLADAAKLASGSVSDVGAARGLTGTFSINGKDIAIASGFGMRADFSYFLLRFDLGFPLKDPRYGPHNTGNPKAESFYSPRDDGWFVPGVWRKPVFQFAIGYPF